ncbi:MAG: zinc metallopeptidase [Bacteroidales bacterium]|nr:zinc metallopeptidase [Bacteroidales bacterium]
MNIWGIFIAVMVLSWIVGAIMKSKFKKYSKIPVDNGMSGKDIAERMLRDNGIYDVTIESVQGQLTDHYNPDKKTINLSQEVYNSRSVAAAAVAAHETGHAVQHATAYAWLSNTGITSYENHDKAQSALKRAAYTYVVAALGSLATLLYYIMIFTGIRDD